MRPKKTINLSLDERGGPGELANRARRCRRAPVYAGGTPSRRGSGGSLAYKGPPALVPEQPAPVAHRAGGVRV